MKINYTNIFCTLLFSFLFFSAKAQVISQLSFYSPLISIFDMKYTNNHLVVSQNGLLIFDVINPNTKPKLIAQIPYPGSVAYTLAVQGNYAYMALGNNGTFAVYDISDFNSPVLKGSVAIPATSFYVYGDLEPHGNYAYLSGFDSLYVLDVSNPSAPKLANAIVAAHTDFTGAEDMVIDNNALFVRTPFFIQVFDITNPVLPVAISTMPNSHPYNKSLSVDTVNHRIFSVWASALQDFTGYDAYSVTDSSAPAFLFSDSTNFGGGDFGISAYSYFDEVLFLSHGGGLNAFDVSNASHDFVTSFTGQDVPNATVSIQVKDSVLFNARGGGLEVLKYATTSEPVCTAPDRLKQQIDGTTAYLHWNKIENAVGYIIRYRAIGTNDWKIVASKDNTKRLNNLSQGTYYTWQVRTACDSSRHGLSDWSLYNIFHGGSANIQDPITFAPNPVHDLLHIHVKDLSLARAIITDLTGNSLIESKIDQQEKNISLLKLKTGIYLLNLVNKDGRVISVTKIYKE